MARRRKYATEAERLEALRASKRRYYARNRKSEIARVSAYQQAARAALVPIAPYWPYGRRSMLIDAVDAMVPRGLPADVRADACQELCLLALTHDTETVRGAVRGAVRKAYGQYALRLDTPVGVGYTLADMLSYDQYV